LISLKIETYNYTNLIHLDIFCYLLFSTSIIVTDAVIRADVELEDF